MNTSTYSIGELAQRSGVSIETIRFYEKRGLIRAPSRTAGGHRVYNDRDVDRMRAVRRCRALDFGLDDIQQFLKMLDADAYTCEEMKSLGLRQLKALDERLEELQNHRQALRQIIRRCDGGQSQSCVLVERIFRDRA